MSDKDASIFDNQKRVFKSEFLISNYAVLKPVFKPSFEIHQNQRYDLTNKLLPWLSHVSHMDDPTTRLGNY